MTGRESTRLSDGHTGVRVTTPPDTFDAQVDCVVVGAGACGLVAALRAHDNGADVLVLERDATPSGSTSLSSGFVPAANTRFQHQAGVLDDTVARFADDIQAKSARRSETSLVALATEHIGPALEWLADNADVPWVVLDDFLYPGHTRHRMHAVPEKTGESLQARLLAAVQHRNVPLACHSRADTLYCLDGVVTGVGLIRPDGKRESVRCEAVVLACNGYGGNRERVERHIPAIANGQYFGHAGNTGDAVQWGEDLHAELKHMSAYQGHGSVAEPHGILITWALMMEGGVQVNAHGQRFSNEHLGYSEQAVHVLAQPGRYVWNVYDQRLHDFALGFPDYQQAVTAGAVKSAVSIEALASSLDVPQSRFVNTLHHVAACQRGEARDTFGRSFTSKPALSPPWYAIRVTGALFHTQGGLMIDAHCRVQARSGNPITGLYAAGGAACGVSGPDVSGYLSGNGLLTALAFGFVAGGQMPVTEPGARLAMRTQRDL